MSKENDETTQVKRSLHNRGGSGTGISYYLTAMDCPMRGHLDQKRKEENLQLEETGTLRRDAGTVFHDLAELYFTGQRPVLEYDDVGDETGAVLEGRRMFKEFKKHFKPDHFGRVIGAEIQLPPDLSPGCDALGLAVAGSAKEAVEKAVGVAPFTARIDLVVQTEREMMIDGMPLEPGVYLVDHKTKKMRDSSAAYTYAHSPQAIAYQVAWNAAASYMNLPKCEGMIFNVVIGHKTMTENSFAQYFVGPPTDSQVSGLQKWLRNAKELAQTRMCNWNACFRYGACAYLTNGLCDREGSPICVTEEE
jgi:hypothetical protein